MKEFKRAIDDSLEALKVHQNFARAY